MDIILVVDFGSQYNQLIARRIRELGVYSELISRKKVIEEANKHKKNLKGIIFSGGPKSVYDEDAYTIDKEVFNLGVPILGICYGLQLITQMHNGNVIACGVKEYGAKTVNVVSDSILFKDTPLAQTVFMSHGDKVDKLSDDFRVVASSDTCHFAGVENTKLNLYGLQFHPEVVHSEYGNKVLSNFIFNVCNSNPTFGIDNYKQILIDDIKKTVGDKKVLLGLSGGVDSSVAAVLIHKAIGNNLLCMFIDHGLLRKNEGDQVMEMFKNEFNINVVRIDCKDRFLSKLAGVSDPEGKRKIIGNEFVYVFDEECKKHDDFEFLAQGTLYTDIIESGTDTAHTIKSHHNVNGLPKDIRFKVLEPLKTLFKDEVRALGKSLGLSDEVVYRQPFPGPGLGIRILGDLTEDKIKLVQDSDFILREEFKKAGLDKTVWQYFTVLTNMKSVGVMGDQRSYSYAVAIRAVSSIDGMTAEFSRIPYEVLEVVSRRIVNEVANINRVLYDVTSKPPSTIEFE